MLPMMMFSCFGRAVFGAITILSSSVFAFRGQSNNHCCQHQSRLRSGCPALTALLAKKILVCFDGSGNSPETNFPDESKNKDFTNILRFHLLAGGSIDRTDDSCYVDGQVSLYDRGIGAQSWENLLPAISRVRGALSKLDFFLGTVETEQVNPMKRRLRKVYEDGDLIYVLGFSRGAASARLFTSKVCQEGIGEVTDPEIEFLGVFDTVLQDQFKNLDQFERNSAGFPPSTKLGEEHEELHPNVKKAVHCVSLDDTRFHIRNTSTIGTFAPALMDASSDRVTEVWFPGSHSNVGGGYFHRGLSDGAFEYMTEWLENLGENKITFLKPEEVKDEALQNSLRGWGRKFADNIDLVRRSLVTKPDAGGQIDLDDGWSNYRNVDSLKKGSSDVGAAINIHESVLDRIKEMKDKYVLNPALQALRQDRSQVITNLDNISKGPTEELRRLLTKSIEA